MPNLQQVSDRIFPARRDVSCENFLGSYEEWASPKDPETKDPQRIVDRLPPNPALKDASCTRLALRCGKPSSHEFSNTSAEKVLPLQFQISFVDLHLQALRC